MTQVRIAIGEGVKICVLGHAEYNTGGPDIVCAAVSTLCGTWQECLLGFEQQGMLISTSMTVEDGVFGAAAVPCSGIREKFFAAASVIITGLRLIEKAYPEYVSVKIVETDREKSQKIADTMLA